MQSHFVQNMSYREIFPLSFFSMLDFKYIYQIILIDPNWTLLPFLIIVTNPMVASFCVQNVDIVLLTKEILLASPVSISLFSPSNSDKVISKVEGTCYEVWQ